MIYLILLSCSKTDAIKEIKVPEKTNHVFYIATDGNDQATGSFEAPLRTVSAVMNKLAPGDTVYLRGGTYHEQWHISMSGTKDHAITFKAYPGEVPLVDGSQLFVSGWQALITMDNVNNITLDGIEIANFITSSGANDPEGIKITGASQNIHINNCKVYNIKNNSPLSAGRSAHAILVIGNNKIPISGLEITNCTVHDTQTGTSENITLAGNIDGFTIRHNTIFNTENIGIIIAGGDNLNPSGDPATNFARNGIINENTLYNISMSNHLDVWGNNGYGAIAIYICGGSETTVERNIVYNSDRGIGLISESNLYATRDCIVRNNFVYNCWRTGIYLGDYLNFVGSGTKNCYILGNTLFKNDRIKGAFGEVEGEIRLTEHCNSNVVINNLIYADTNDLFIHKYTSTGAHNVIDYNLYFAEEGNGSWNWQSIQNENNYSDFNSWQSASGQDQHSISGVEPRLKNIPLSNLHLQTTFITKDQGYVLQPNDLLGSTDIDGHSKINNGKISIGAQQLP